MENEEALIQEEAENKIIDWITNNSEDRLTIFKLVSDEKNFTDGEKIIKNADLIVKKKGEYDYKSTSEEASKSTIVHKRKIFGTLQKKRNREISISVIKQVKTDKNNIFKKNINIRDFNPQKDFYLLFVFFDTFKGDIADYVCLISSENFLKICDKTEDKNILKFESFLSPEKKDKYAEFLVNKKKLARALLDLIFFSRK